MGAWLLSFVFLPGAAWASVDLKTLHLPDGFKIEVYADVPDARELTLGVEAVLADGRLYQGLNALNKDNTGYDLKDLLVGAEGTLGFITAATLKLFPIPEGQETALVNVASPEVALELFYLLRERTGTRLTAFELMNRFGIDLQLRHGMLARDPAASMSPWYVLAEVSRMKGSAPGAGDGLRRET